MITRLKTNKDFIDGYEKGRADAEEEVENRYNRVLDDEKRISYEQGKADAIEEVKEAINDSGAYQMNQQITEYDKGSNDAFEIVLDILEQLKEQK